LKNRDEACRATEIPSVAQAAAQAAAAAEVGMQSATALLQQAALVLALEAFFHDRLRQLGVINDKDHPKYMQPLSTVVLSSTYCYHQLVACGHDLNPAAYPKAKPSPLTTMSPVS
jgi:hypothetical protein